MTQTIGIKIGAQDILLNCCTPFWCLRFTSSSISAIKSGTDIPVVSLSPVFFIITSLGCDLNRPHVDVSVYHRSSSHLLRLKRPHVDVSVHHRSSSRLLWTLDYCCFLILIKSITIVSVDHQHCRCCTLGHLNSNSTDYFTSKSFSLVSCTGDVDA